MVDDDSPGWTLPLSWYPTVREDSRVSFVARDFAKLREERKSAGFLAWLCESEHKAKDREARRARVATELAREFGAPCPRRI